MADVFHQLYVQVVFAVRNRRSQLDELCKYVLNQKPTIEKLHLKMSLYRWLRNLKLTWERRFHSITYHNNLTCDISDVDLTRLLAFLIGYYMWHCIKWKRDNVPHIRCRSNTSDCFSTIVRSLRDHLNIWYPDGVCMRNKDIGDVPPK